MNSTPTVTPKKPNIEKLARLIVRTGYADQIMKTLEMSIRSGIIRNPDSLKGGENV